MNVVMYESRYRGYNLIYCDIYCDIVNKAIYCDLRIFFSLILRKLYKKKHTMICMQSMHAIILFIFFFLWES